MMWWLPLLIIAIGIGTASVAPIPVAKVQVGNETVTITTADIMYRLLWGPVMKGISKALSRIPPEVQAHIALNISKELDKLEYNAKTLIEVYHDTLVNYWPSILDTVKELNSELSGEAVPYVTVCGFKGVVQVCRLYELSSEPGFVRIAVNVTPGQYLTIRIPFGILVAVNENIERGNYDVAVKLLLKRVIRGDIECNVDISKVQRMVQERLRIRERVHSRPITIHE